MKKANSFFQQAAQEIKAELFKLGFDVVVEEGAPALPTQHFRASHDGKHDYFDNGSRMVLRGQKPRSWKKYRKTQYKA